MGGKKKWKRTSWVTLSSFLQQKDKEEEEHKKAQVAEEVHLVKQGKI